MATDYELLQVEWSKACDLLAVANKRVAEVIGKMSRTTPPHIMEELRVAQEEWKAARKQLDDLAAKL